MTTSPDPMLSHKRAVGLFPTRRAAERALYDLQEAGFPIQRVSIAAQDAAGPTTGRQIQSVTERRTGNRADDGAKVGALSGGLLGALTGLLVGVGTLAIPGIGPIMLAGAAATALVTTAAGTGIGAIAGGLLGSLIGLGIPEDHALVYHNHVLAGEYLLIVEGTEAALTQVEALLRHHDLRGWQVYPLATVAPVQPVPVTPAVTPPDAFQAQSVRIEVFEEVPEIRRQVVVREEVKIRKQTEQETVDTVETVRREELEVNTQGHPIVETPRPS